MKNIYLILLTLSISFSQSFDPSQIEFTISIEKDIFLLDEPIYVEMNETNIGNFEVLTSTLNIEITPYFLIQLISPNGKNLNEGPGRGHGIYDRPVSGELIKQGDSKYFVFRLNQYFGERDPRDYAIHTRYLPEGTYRLQITHYSNQNYMYEKLKAYYDAGGHTNDVEASVARDAIDKMPVVSNEITFSIVKPVGKQEQEWRDYMYTMQQYILKRREDNTGAYEVLRDFYTKYPDSSYLSRIVQKSFYLSLTDIKGSRFISLSEEYERTKNNFSSFLIAYRCRSLYADIYDDKRYITPQKIAFERSAVQFKETVLGKYFQAEARDKQHQLDRLQAKGLEEGSSR